MDLQVSVFLLFALLTAGHALNCYECLGLCLFQSEKTCPSGLSKCLSATTVPQSSSYTLKTKGKGCATDCASGTLTLGTSKMSLECCNTDGCNAREAPDPNTNAPNGKSCYTCDEKSCSNTVNCLGTEDRCIKATLNIESASAVIKGCSSKSICSSSLPDIGFNNISCCEGNLCNAAPSVSLSFSFLCCCLFFILIT